VYGDLMALLTVMKGLPLAYNKDMQEDKEPVFDAADTVRGSLRACREMVLGMAPKRARMLEAARGGYTTATDLADYLVGKGLPFREAHEVVGKVVRVLVDSGREMDSLTLEELKGFYPGADASALERLKVESSVDARDHIGGTARRAVLERITLLKELRSKT
jgi:argininosuccinate lyase